MKKLVLLLAVVFGMSLVSCDNAKQEGEQAAEEVQEAVEQVTDSAAAAIEEVSDSAKAAIEEVAAPATEEAPAEPAK